MNNYMSSNMSIEFSKEKVKGRESHFEAKRCSMTNSLHKDMHKGNVEESMNLLEINSKLMKNSETNKGHDYLRNSICFGQTTGNKSKSSWNRARTNKQE